MLEANKRATLAFADLGHSAVTRILLVLFKTNLCLM